MYSSYISIGSRNTIDPLKIPKKELKLFNIQKSKLNMFIFIHNKLLHLYDCPNESAHSFCSDSKSTVHRNNNDINKLLLR